jgi:type II secretory pathway predicted ATPase ExeA
MVMKKTNCTLPPCLPLKDLFEHDAVALITAHCRGNRRQIMNTATLLLDEAYYRQENTVNAQTTLECDLVHPDNRN